MKFDSPETILPHTHLLVQHLLKQLEHPSQRRDDRDPRPDWLVEFVEQLADHFAPLSGVGRVGCECEAREDGWEARLYLGATELVGGKDDGQARNCSFELQLSELLACFSTVSEVRWNVAAGQGGDPGGSFITVRGTVHDQPVCIKAYSRAPAHAGPALRQYHDGRVQPVE